MGRKLPGVLMFLLVVLGLAEADCSSSCSATSCDCSNQGLTRVPRDLPATITDLDLGSNHIQILHDLDFLRYESVETLDIGNNSISVIEYYSLAFYSTNLTTLRLSYNQIASLPAGMFRWVGTLQEVFLSHNRINDIQPTTFSPIPQLTKLFLNNNKLTSLRADIFAGLESLQILQLQSNEISDIQAGTFNSTPQLTELYLDNNKVTNLRSDMFTGLGNLETLYLNNNEISDIQAGTFSSTPQLRHVRLSDNSITMFPFEELSNQTFYHLYLDNNQLTTLPSMAYDILASIPFVGLTNNPWYCDCRIVDFRLRMTGYYDFEHQIICDQPGHLHGLHLKDINPTDLMSDDIYPTIVRFEKSDDVALYHGETLRLVCEASGIPTPDITVILPSGQNATVESAGRVTVDVDGAIAITNVTAADAGLYVCIAKTSVGSKFAMLSVDIAYEEPKIVSFEIANNGSLAQGEMVILVCEASGIPTPDITVVVPSGLNSSVKSSGSLTADASGSIIVANVTTTDAGLYICVAANSVGSTFAALVVDMVPVPVATFSLPVLIGAVCGSIAGTVLIGGITLAIWCRRNTKIPPKGPDVSVVFNNTNTTTTVITNNQTGQPQPISEFSNDRNSQHAPRPAYSQFEPYEDVEPPPNIPRPRGAVPRQTATRQVLILPNRNKIELPPVPPPRTISSGYETVSDDNHESSHHYQSLRKPENSAGESQNHYQSLQRPQQPH
ncbi:uncharacterized protein LOC144861623 [Branchiostoma floridae x Branchiostoma japonicum]